MRFCVDESSFLLPEGQDERLTMLVEDFVELFQECREQVGGDIGLWSQFYMHEVRPGLILTNLLFDLDYAHLLDEAPRKALIAALQRCVVWDEQYELPEPVEVEVDGLKLEAPTLAFAHDRAAEHKAIAALGLCSSERHGRKEVKRREESRPVHFVTCSQERQAYLRDVPELEDMSAQQYMDHAPLAFPTLRFVDGLASQFSRFSRAYQAIRPDVTRHLAALEDHFQAILRDYRGETSKVMAGFRARCGIDASPEGPKTHQNAKAMEQRRVVIDGQRVTCEWHTKIEPDRDRIHFHPGSPEVADGRIVIGIFHEHLAT